MRATPEGQGAADARAAEIFAQLRDVNEQLVLAAVRAQLDAESLERVAESKARAAELDALTMLPNRMLLRDRFAQAAAIAQRHGNRLALLFVDLNNFKQINDTLGHTVGDVALRRAAECLTAAVRGADTVSRHGGDEFVLLLTDLAHPVDAARIAEKVSAAVSAPFRVDDHVVRLSASIGISIFPDDGSDLAALIDLSDAAMYRAKRRGPGLHAFHGDEKPGELVLDRPVPAAPHAVMHVDAAADEQVRREAELREANEKLVLAVLSAQAVQAAAEDAQRRQVEFIAMLAHELRNPLAPMRNVSAMLARVEADDPILPRLQTIIERQVVHMARLVDDLLDVSRAHTGKLRLERSVVLLSVVIAESIEASRPAMDVRLQHFSLTLPSRALSVDGDPMRLTQILTNLLDNASKYTPKEGEISLALSEADGCAVIVVSDSGIGIPAESLPGVFALFAQAPDAVHYNRLGLGIGLNVVQELVLAHGGSVIARSAGKGQGSQFIVTLPLVPTRPSLDPG